MPLDPLDTSRFSANEKSEETGSLSRDSPRQRLYAETPSPYQFVASSPSTWSTIQDHRCQGDYPPIQQAPDISPSSSTAMLAHQRPVLSRFTASDGTSGSSRGSPTGEDSLTVRRREANRLAAQRFRSRKKGYQESLEEKVRQLEEDKELLVRRLTEAFGVPLPPRRRSVGRVNDDRGEIGGVSKLGASGNMNHALSPEHREMPVDADVRIAALKSANRRLQEELRCIHENNDRLRQELEYWRLWEGDQRKSAWSVEAGRRDDGRVSPKAISPFTSASFGDGSWCQHFHSRPTSRNSQSPHAAQPTYSLGIPAPPFSQTPPPLSPAEHPRLSTSPGIRLPPVRLAPLQVVTSSDCALSGIGASPSLPRPAEMDGIKLDMKPPQIIRSSGASGDDRRRGGGISRRS
ncbi:hypothetical protein DB88DRAFT_130424 [Papiliotrema laurentii]|uniref:BZIP domain-containing protein n=1 Tax=Papiliotrema laurentii TaxID=5418 RepID=A0AAD9FPP0_PAPLA|nr:hypothetical protein DB88DRAFT_130424 [Papiliotrema laurentii]